MYGGLLLMQSKRDLLRWFMLKVKKVKYLNTGCINLTCLRPTEALKFAKFIAPVEFDTLRELATATTDDLTGEQISQHIEDILTLVRKHKRVDTVWLRPLAVAPYLNGLIEDALLCNGYRVVYQDNQIDRFENGTPKYKMAGWWEMTYEE